MARVKRRWYKLMDAVLKYGDNIGQVRITFRCGHSYVKTDVCTPVEEVRQQQRDMITELCNDCWKDRWRYLTTNILTTHFRITDVMDYIDTTPEEIKQMTERTIDDVDIIR